MAGWCHGSGPEGTGSPRQRGVPEDAASPRIKPVRQASREASARTKRGPRSTRLKVWKLLQSKRRLVDLGRKESSNKKGPTRRPDVLGKFHIR